MIVPKVNNSEISVDTIVWLTSLNESQRGVTGRIVEDLEPMLNYNEIKFELYEIKSAADFHSRLAELANRVAHGILLPIIHIDMHGSEEKGFYIEATNENVAWSTAIDKFRDINIAMRNNLIIISLACFSFSIIKRLSILKPVPFHILIAPHDEISSGFIQENVPTFYHKMFEEDDIMSAIKYKLFNKTDVFESEHIFREAFSNYIKQSCIGKNRVKRIEYLLTEARKNDTILNNLDLKTTRNLLKKQLKDLNTQLETYSKIFLIGRPINFSLAHLLKKLNAPGGEGGI